MPLDEAAQNLAADATRAVTLRLALHTGDPGAGAANEVAGGGYLRQAATWDAAAGGVSLLTAMVEFSVPAVTVTYATLWDTAGTTRYGKALLSPAGVFPVAGKLRLVTGSIDWTA